MAEQLIKKTGEGYSNVMPKSWIEAITDKSTGESLTHILQGFNMYFLSYTGNTEQTRCQVPKILRKKGLWITYVKYDGNVYTEWYNSNDIDDKSWGNSSNWRIGNNELVGDLTISANGNWVINGNETEFKAIGEKGNTPLIRIANNKLQVSYDTGNTYHNVSDNPVYTQIRTYNNKLQISTDLGANWTDASDEIAAYFRFNSGQGNNVGSIQISRNNKDWNDLSGNFVNNLHISKYIGADETLPTSGIAEGTIYAKGPTYADSDTSHSNPIYRLWVYAYKGSTLAWQDNGEFNSISAGVVQELGTSQNQVISQKCVSQEIIQGGVYDVSSHNNSAVFESLQALLSSSNLSTLIPALVRHGGMSIKFIQGPVQNPNNKYVQYRLMADSFSTSVTDWQGVDKTPTASSQNLVTSGAVEQVVGSDFLIEKDSSGSTKYSIRVGHTYTIINLLSSHVNVSTRETKEGDNHDTTGVPANSTVLFTPTVNGEWIRTGAACKIQIIDNDSLLARVRKNETDIDTIVPIIEKHKLSSSVAKYCVKEEGFKTNLYWYEDGTTHKVASTIESQLMSGVISAINVVEGDKVMFNLSGTSQTIIILADDSDNVIANYSYTSAAPLNGKLVIPAGCTKLYCNTLKSTVSDSFLVVNGEYIDNILGQINSLKSALWVIQPVDVQTGKGCNASTGVITDTANSNAVVIDLTQVKAKQIKFVLTVSGTYGYGFIVNGAWSGKRYASFPSGLYYQQLDIEVPEGATEFRFSWNTTYYTEDNPIYCILEDALVTVYKDINDVKSTVTSLENVMFKERVLDISNTVSNGGILLDGTFDTNMTFGHIEIPLNKDVVYKSFTFNKTYVNNNTRCCYGFVINNQWIGYPGIESTLAKEEVTVMVPKGATVFRVSWNRNIITDNNYILRALSTPNNTDTDTDNKPIFQFTPDFVLSRVPQLECPSKATVLALKPAQVYDMYDGLMALYPKYITKVDCDAAAQAALKIAAPSYMEGLPIYMYKFTPKIGGNDTGADQTSRFKILITSMHPQEKFGILAMFNMVKMICKNWANDVNAEQLRSLVDIYIMPCPWPWNMENGSRVNYNGVNGNRQFPTSKWAESGQGTQNWSGTEPLSEYEAKVINYFLLQIQPHVSVDVHTSGNDNVGHMGIFLVNKFDKSLVDLCGVIARTTSNRAIQDNSNFPQDGDTCMYGVYPEDARTMGEFYEYAYEQGCKYSILSEESPYSNWTNGMFGGTSVSPTEEYTNGILREQVQYLFNTVLRLTKAASIQYYSN